MAGVLVYQGAVAELNTELSSIHQKIVISCYGLKLFSDVTMLTIELLQTINRRGFHNHGEGPYSRAFSWLKVLGR